MDLSIHGSFEPYVYVAFWQLSLAGLQQIRLAQGFDQEKNRILKFYASATFLVATAMNWMTWGLAIWIWLHYDAARALVFFLLSFVTSVVALWALQSHREFLLPTHVFGVPGTPIFAYCTIVSLGLPISL